MQLQAKANNAIAEVFMKYMLLIYQDEQALSEAEREACYAESIPGGERCRPGLHRTRQGSGITLNIMKE